MYFDYALQFQCGSITYGAIDVASKDEVKRTLHRVFDEDEPAYRIRKFLHIRRQTKKQKRKEAVVIRRVLDGGGFSF